MRKLGLIGGMSIESTIPYYHDIVYGVKKALGENKYPELTIESVDVFKVVEFIENKNYDEVTKYLLNSIENLKRAGADFAVLTANTAHIVFDRLKECSPIPLISIIESVVEEVQKRNLKKIGLIGTIFTMKGEFYKKTFTDNGIEIITPSDDEMEYINYKIINELEMGITKDETLRGFQRIIERMKIDDGIEQIILGCTELPLILNEDVIDVKIINSMEVHIADIIKEILK